MIKLNLGSGYKKLDGYITVDNDSKCNPDHVLDLETDRLPFDDSTVDEVLAHHILEHLGDGFFHVMREIYRVCKNGAIVDIAVPHPRHDTFLIDPTHKRPIYPYTMDMFSKARNLRDIELGGNVTTVALQNNVDFELITHEFKLDPYYLPIFQKATEEECEFIARSQNNVIVEITMKLMVIKE